MEVAQGHDFCGAPAAAPGKKAVVGIGGLRPGGPLPICRDFKGGCDGKVSAQPARKAGQIGKAERLAVFIALQGIQGPRVCIAVLIRRLPETAVIHSTHEVNGFPVIFQRYRLCGASRAVGD